MYRRCVPRECIVKIRLQTKGNFDVQCALAYVCKIGHKLASGPVIRASSFFCLAAKLSMSFTNRPQGGAFLALTGVQASPLPPTATPQR